MFDDGIDVDVFSLQRFPKDHGYLLRGHFPVLYRRDNREQHFVLLAVVLAEPDFDRLGHVVKPNDTFRLYPDRRGTNGSFRLGLYVSEVQPFPDSYIHVSKIENFVEKSEGIGRLRNIQ